MATYRYRAATPSGKLRAGTLQVASTQEAVARLRALGLVPIETVKTSEAAAPSRLLPNAATRQAVAHSFSELAVLLSAGLPLDRALRLLIDNTVNATVRTEMERVSKRVTEGAPFSVAVMESQGVLPSLAGAMAESGEASGALDTSLMKLGEMLERTEALRQTVMSAMIYPAMLVLVALAVILVMLLWVVPQFETLFESGRTTLPPMTVLVVSVSHGVRDYGLYILVAIVIAGIAASQIARRPTVRLILDRDLLIAPLLGDIVRKAETARFSRTLGSLVEGGVSLHTAISIAGRTLGNRHMAAAIGRVVVGLKEGGGLSRPLQEARIFPPLALSFIRTGEETARLGPMLNKLADVLDRDVRIAIDRVVTVMTPVITIFMGAIVATVIASIMTAILGFNDLAATP